MDISVFAQNYRGFKELNLTLNKMTFVTGDNSSGKSSILLLLHYIFSTELFQNPALDKNAVYDRYDFFSPYFDYNDVNIGYIIKTDKEYVGRAISLHRSDSKKAIITKLTWFKGDKAISLKRQNKKFSYRLFSEKISEIDALKKLHHEYKNFIPLETPETESNKIFIMPELIVFPVLKNLYGKNKKSKEADDWLLWLTEYRLSAPYLPSSMLTDPIRKSAARLYEAECEFDSKGGHFASRLFIIEKEKKQEEIDLIKDFGRKSKLFDDIHATPVNSGASTSYLQVELIKNGQKFFLDQMGAGVAQVLPIIIDTASLMEAKQRQILLLLQQPELHLHPVAQAELGSFFYQMAGERLCYVIETHSDYLIDRFCVNMKENNKKGLTAQIIFCENDEEGNTYHTIKIAPDGELKDVPDNYRKFFIQEAIRTM